MLVPPAAACRYALATAVAAVLLTGATTRAATFKAGARIVDIAPTTFPVIVNAMFTERSADRVVDPLQAKALVLDDGTQRIAVCVIDSCMVPRDLLDQAKELASAATGIPVERMLMSATHTHSAPSAMGCLGSRVDPRYAASLPPRLANAVIEAARNLVPARLGWTAYDDWDHTFNRRWIRRPDRMLTDPFGAPSVRAHMHPGHESPDAIGPSGPVDPGFSMLAVATTDGRPLALLGNYSQHYYGSPLLSSDYYGRFARHLAEGLGTDERFVALLSQGTSGDQMWMDYGAPQREIGYDAYAREMADRAAAAWRRVVWHEHVPLRMAERRITLGFRVPDETRLAWAREKVAALGDRLPANLPEIYATEALHLHRRPTAELRLQALAIGDLGITAIPNEVFAITGLKLKTHSPLVPTFNIALANGAEGYIPPPEQHALGGYTTWPARTAGLETNAEPRIVETLLSLLEEVSGKPRRAAPVEHGPYARAILDARPHAYWRLDELVIPEAADATGQGHRARFEMGVALHLPGVGSGTGVSPEPALQPSAFSGPLVNRAIATAGGRLRATFNPGRAWSVEGWFWNGLPADARAVTGYLVSRGPNGNPDAPGDHLGIGGTHLPESTGRLFVFNGNARNQMLQGRTPLALKTWHHVALVRDGARIRVHLDGRVQPEIDGELEPTTPPGTADLFVGGRSDNLFGLEGRVDEVAVFDRALTPLEIQAHHRAAGIPARTPAPATPPLSPDEALNTIQVRPGFRVELMASEPLTVDPVAIDWDFAGRLWVVEMSDYPLGMDGEGQPGGRVRRLEDTDGDGRPDRAVLFAESLNFPTGILAWRDGVLVSAPPEILFLRDTDGDGRADRREVVVSGLMEGNQQLRANGLRWGLDNRVHCAAGGHHPGHGAATRLRTKAGEVAVGSRDFRFDPDTGELEPESGPSQFGRNRDDYDRWFGTQNIRPLWHYVLEDRYLRRNPHLPAPDPTRLVVTPLSPKVWPASPPEKRYHSFNEAGHFTSACSGMIYRDDLLFGPQPEDPLHAFTCEPFHNLVQHNVVRGSGVSFVATRDPAEDGREFFASTDRWCRPVMTRTGPDGALWVVDMYRYMIEHPEWLPAEGRAELMPHYRLGDDRGRLYRVFPTHAPPRRPGRLDTLEPAALVAALDSSNEWQRDKAHQILMHRRDTSSETVQALIRLLRDSPDPRARIHALALLDGLGSLSESDLIRALRDASPGLRAFALRLSERRPSAGIITAAVALASDPDAKVRLQLALSLGEWNTPDAGAALASLSLSDGGDAMVRAAVLSSAVPHLLPLATAVASAPEPLGSALGEPLAELALAVRQRDALAALLGPLLSPPSPAAAQASPGTYSRLAAVLRLAVRKAAPLATLGTGDDLLARAWARLPQRLAGAETDAFGPGAPSDLALAAATLLAAHPETRSAALPRIARWLNPALPEATARAALAILAAHAGDQAPELLLTPFETLPPALRLAVVDVLLSREPWTRALLERGGRSLLPVLDAQRRSRLERHASPRVRELAGGLFQPAPVRAAVMAAFQPALDLAGDPARGRVVYDRLCLTCHRRGDEGREVGPDLVSVVAHPPAKLLTNILDPNADIQPGYQAFEAELRDGTELQGLIGAETANSLTFRLTDGTTRAVLRTEIVRLRGGSLSLMPEGLEAGLTPQDFADLIRYLRTPR